MPQIQLVLATFFRFKTAIQLTRFHRREDEACGRPANFVVVQTAACVREAPAAAAPPLAAARAARRRQMAPTRRVAGVGALRPLFAYSRFQLACCQRAEESGGGGDARNKAAAKKTPYLRNLFVPFWCVNVSPQVARRVDIAKQRVAVVLKCRGAGRR